MRNQLNYLNKITHKTRLKSLIEFYSWLLRNNRIKENGPASHRLTYLKTLLTKREIITDKYEDIKRIYSWIKNEKEPKK